MDAKKGIDVILLYRFLKNTKTEEAWKMAFQEEHKIGLSRKTNATPTKDGNIQTLSAVEYDFSAKSIIAKGDTHVDDIKNGLINGDIIEIWEIDKAEVGTLTNANKYKATYYQGYVTSYTTTDNSEDSLELELEFGINGIGQPGYTALTADQSTTVQYVFKDTTQTS